METEFDAVVVGSGFGGAVTAARLAEAGWRVLVLERGRRWQPAEYPRGPGDAWFYDVDEPHKQNGWLDFRWFGDMSVAMGAGVGGGSLIYGNVSIIPPRESFAAHWPRAISYDALLPHYEAVGRMLNVKDMPDHQLPLRYHAAKKGAEAIGAAARFRKVPLAVSFDPQWTYDQPDAHEDHVSRRFTNAQGREQGTCNHCGFCCTGCHLKAKNTLDLNYLAVAEDHGARILPLHVVDTVQPEDDGYVVHAQDVSGGRRQPVQFRARRVILSAGSLGSTEILLRSRDEKGFLPALSSQLGAGWSSNGDFLTFSTHEENTGLTRGPTISCAIDFLDDQGYEGARIFVEDGALGDIANAWMRAALLSMRRWFSAGWYLRLLGQFLLWLRHRQSVPHLIAWFAQSVDAADGRLQLRRPWYAPWRRRLHLDWDIRRSEKTFEAVNRLHTALARANNAKRILTPPTWTVLRDLATPHPLGGCRMADSRETGVVDHRGEVFGYPGLYVADGAIIPCALGINPSRTIAALAERNAALMLAETTANTRGSEV